MKANNHQELLQTVQAAYDRLLRERGEIFERSLALLDDADKKEIKSTQRLLVILLILALTLFGGTLIFVWDGTYQSYFFLAFIVAITLVSLFYYKRYDRLMADGKKEMIKGVITDKKKIDDGDNVDYDLMISNKESVSVSRKDFKAHDLGDIITIEVLSGESGMNLKRKVTRHGNILERTVKTNLDKIE